MRPPLPKMIDVAELFPKAEQRPFTVHDAWEKINIFEIVSTMTELTFILSKKDSMKAYNALQELMGE